MATELAEPIAAPSYTRSNKPRPRIQTAVKQAIIADLARGIQQQVIADRLGISRQTVVRINADFKLNAAKHTSEVTDTWRDRIVTKSIKSVERALDDDTDSYKSAHIGVASLKGLGVFTEQAMVGIHVLMESMPRDIGEIDITPDADE